MVWGKQTSEPLRHGIGGHSTTDSEKLEGRILVVDGRETVCEFLRDLLTPEGYEVNCVPDGKSVMKSLASAEIDLVLIAVEEVNIDGENLVTSIRESFPQTIVLVMSEYSSVGSARGAVVLGAEDYVLKPLQEEEVLKSVRGSLDKARMAEENRRLKETVAIFRMSEMMNSAIKKESLYRIIVDSALNQTRSSLGALVIYNEEKQRLDVPYCSYIEGGNLHFPQDYLSYPAVDFVLKKSRPLMLVAGKRHGLARKMDYLEYSSEVFPEILPFEKELILYPIRTPHSHTIGFIVVSKKLDEASFTSEDVKLLGIIAGQSSFSVHNAFLVEGLERNYVSTLMSLNAILEAKHPYTRGHTQRVTRSSTTIARALGLTSNEVKVMRDGAMLHDIGKIGISDAILNKPGRLDDEEIDIVRRHPIIGETIIKPIKFLEPMLPIIRHHHERMDGRGWPDGLFGSQIPLLVRICTLADAYDAMADRRSYREPMEEEDIRKELIRHCGIQFDEELVEVFLRLMDEGKINAPEEQRRPALLKV